MLFPLWVALLKILWNLHAVGPQLFAGVGPCNSTGRPNSMRGRWGWGLLLGRGLRGDFPRPPALLGNVRASRRISEREPFTILAISERSCGWSTGNAQRVARNLPNNITHFGHARFRDSLFAVSFIVHQQQQKKRESPGDPEGLRVP